MPRLLALCVVLGALVSPSGASASGPADAVVGLQYQPPWRLVKNTPNSCTVRMTRAYAKWLMAHPQRMTDQLRRLDGDRPEPPEPPPSGRARNSGRAW
jgi:hypothetical protein